MAGRGERTPRKRSRDPSIERGYYQTPLGGRIGRATSTNRTISRPPTYRRRPSEDVTPPDSDYYSPSRRVRWEPQLERGATPSDPLGHRRASQSPSRSAMANPTARNSRTASLHRERDQDFIREHERDLMSGPTQRLPEVGDKDRDQYLCQIISGMRLQIDIIAQSISSSAGLTNATTVEKLCEDVENAQLLRYIGCLAMGGSRGIDDWNAMLSHPTQVKALIMGIISRALREKVFSELWFGGSESQIRQLEDQEDGLKEEDGFLRTKKRAALCRDFMELAEEGEDDYLVEAETTLCVQLEKMLIPLYESCSGTTVRNLPNLIRTRLRSVVEQAASLSREIRTLSDIVLYWPPTFKDEEFDPQRMECLNTTDMIEVSPYKKRTVNGHATAVLEDPSAGASRDEAIVRIVAFPGIVAYRQGGGSMAKKMLAEERKHDDNAPPDVQYSRQLSKDSPWNLTGREGFRTRVICKSIVYLVWGKQRLLTKEAGTSAHLDAKRDGREEKYNADRQGFVELYDVFMQLNPQAAAAMAM